MKRDEGRTSRSTARPSSLDRTAPRRRPSRRTSVDTGTMIPRQSSSQLPSSGIKTQYTMRIHCMRPTEGVTIEPSRRLTASPLVEILTAPLAAASDPIDDTVASLLPLNSLSTASVPRCTGRLSQCVTPQRNRKTPRPHALKAKKNAEHDTELAGSYEHPGDQPLHRHAICQISGERRRVERDTVDREHEREMDGRSRVDDPTWSAPDGRLQHILLPPNHHAPKRDV